MDADPLPSLGRPRRLLQERAINVVPAQGRNRMLPGGTDSWLSFSRDEELELQTAAPPITRC